MREVEHAKAHAGHPAEVVPLDRAEEIDLVPGRGKWTVGIEPEGDRVERLDPSSHAERRVLFARPHAAGIGEHEAGDRQDWFQVPRTVGGESLELLHQRPVEVSRAEHQVDDLATGTRRLTRRIEWKWAREDREGRNEGIP